MCGIAGYRGHVEPRVLDHMLAHLVHRGPDELGKYQVGHIGLGVRRLQVMDPTHGQQPMSDETGRVQVVLNGEIYNHQELRRELQEKGHRFHSHCDTEVVAHLFEEEGEGVFQRLRGMFAIALWDEERQTLHLARDPFGIKPLYVAAEERDGEGDRLLLFSSELPSLLAVLPESQINLKALAPFFSHLYTPNPDTIFEGITQLRPGEVLSSGRGHIARRRYAQLGQDVHMVSKASAAEIHEEWRHRIQESVQAHLMSDVPLGLFLSGGLDSGAILAMMRQEISGPIRTFSIGYQSAKDQAYNELEAASLLARHFETDHHAEMIQPDVVNLLPNIIAAMGEPFADSSSIPTYLISQIASRQVTVGLSGIGGDELFGGYPRYLGLRYAKYYRRVPRFLRSGAARVFVPWITESSDNQNRGGRLKRFLRDGDRPLAEQYVNWTTFLPQVWGGAAFSDDLQGLLDEEDFMHDYVGMFHDWNSPYPEDKAMGLDLQTYLPDDLLRMADRLSMAHSLEVRVPFCDPSLLAFAQTIPPQIRFAGWQVKGGMRKSLQSVLPPEILTRPKYGFQVPLARWLREDLREMVHDMLSEQAVKARGYLNPAYVQWLIREHESGARNLADQLYAVLTFEVWMKHYESTAQEHRRFEGAIIS